MQGRVAGKRLQLDCCFGRFGLDIGYLGGVVIGSNCNGRGVGCEFDEALEHEGFLAAVFFGRLGIEHGAERHESGV